MYKPHDVYVAAVSIHTILCGVLLQEVRPGVWMLPSSDGTWWCARPAGTRTVVPAAAAAGASEGAAGAAAVEAAAA
jgi:hypothetical protein